MMGYAMKRTTNYLPFIAIFILPLLFYPVVDSSLWQSSSDVHAFFEFASSLLAITAGIMVLLHFFTTGRLFFLIISIGFVLIGTEEFVHAIFSFSRTWPETIPTFKLAISTTWLTGHLVLLASFFFALVYGKKEIVQVKRIPDAVVYNILGLIFAVVAALMIFNSPFLPHFVQLGSITKKITELSLALLYFIAFLLYSNVYFKQQHRSPLLWSIVAFIIFRVLAHIYVFDARNFYDSHWDTAHLIVFLSYFFPIFGVWGETYKLHSSSQAQLNKLGIEMNERKQAEEALHKSEERFRLLSEAAFEAVVIHEEGVLINANSQYFKMFGYEPEETLGKDMMSVTIAPEALEFAKNQTDMDSSGPYESIGLRKDGTRFPMELRGRKMEYKGRSVRFGVIIDITERKRVEQALRESEEKYRELVRYAPAGIYELDYETNRLTSVNDILCEYTGYTRDELLGIDFINFLTEESQKLLHSRIEKIKAGEKIEPTVEFCIRTKNGNSFWGLFNVSHIYESGKLKSATGIINNITDRKLAEEQLRRANAFLDSIVENIPDMIFLKDARYLRYLQFNRAGEDLLGYSRIDMIGKSDYDFFPKEQADHFNEKDREVLNGKKVLDIPEENVQTLNKGVRILHTKKVPLLDANGEPEFLLGISEDITERKKAEEALRESENQFGKMISWVPGMIYKFTKRPDGTYYVPFSTQGIRDIFGCSPEDVSGDFSPITRVILPEDLDKVISTIEFSAGHLSIWECEYRVQIPGQPVKWLLGQSTPERMDDGSITWYGFNTDITGRKQAEEALLESESRYRLLSEHTTDTVFMMDMNLKMTYHSPSGEKLRGFTVKEIMEMPLERQVTPESLKLVSELFLNEIPKVIADPGYNPIRLLDLEYSCKDGSTVWAESKFSIIRDEKSGRPVSILGEGRNVTDRKRAEEEKVKLVAQLQQAQKMESVGRLAGGVAHDFNNMLAVILGHAELALMKIDPAQPHHADLQEIRMAAERSAELTRQLLAFARKQTVSPIVLDLNETVEGMLNMLRKLIGEDIDLAWLPGAGVWPVRVDPSQIDQILANLCVNARDAIAGVGRITIETGTNVFDRDYCLAHPDFMPGEYVRMTVIDNGCGMDRETLANVFEPFFTTKEVGKGTGLGLATVYGIVNQNNGFIDVYSEPGQGTTFSIYLPRYESRVKQPQSEDSSKKPMGGHETILLVEDEPAILNMTRIMLIRLGYTVLAASGPGDAISLAKGHDSDVIHLVMTDVVMPEMNGSDLVMRLSSLYPHIKSLFMSGYTADIIAHHGVLDEGVCFIQKPFSLLELASKVRQALDGKL